MIYILTEVFWHILSEILFLVCQPETNVCFGKHQSASSFECLMGMVFLRLLHPPCSLGHASRWEHYSHGQQWPLPINEWLQCSSKFPYLQKAPVAGLCVEIFVAVLRKENISFADAESTKLFACYPETYSQRDPALSCKVLCVLCGLFISLKSKSTFFCTETQGKDALCGCFSCINLYSSQRCQPNLQPFIG